MSRFSIDADNDWERSGGSFVRVTGEEEIRQGVKFSLLIFRGEAWLDTTIGVPYFEEVFNKQVAPAIVSSVFRDAILASDGVTGIVSLSTVFDPTTRNVSLSFEATASLDELASDITVFDTLEVGL